MFKTLRKINPWLLIYIAISACTFTHTTYSSAMIFDGNNNTDTFKWWFDGDMIAVTVDIGLLMAGHFYAKKHNGWMLATYLTAALMSVFLQLFYASMFTGNHTWSTGVNSQWQTLLQPLIDASFVIVPCALPLLSVMYTLSSSAYNKQLEPKFAEKLKSVETIENPSDLPALNYRFHCKQCDKTSSAYDSKEKLLRFSRKHATQVHQITQDGFIEFAKNNYQLSE